MKSLRYRCQQSKESLLAGQPFRFIDNGGSILGVAHVDFVGCGRERHFRQNGRTVYSTTLDDRLGVHILLDRLPAMGIVCDVLLTDDEEIGRSTASQFIPPKEYNWIVEFDRRGSGAVVYDYDEMVGPAKKYFGKVHSGSFSDICFLDHLGVAGLNIGTGYYQEHTRHSWASLNVVRDQLNKFKVMYDEMKDTRVDHEPRPAKLDYSWTSSPSTLKDWTCPPDSYGDDSDMTYVWSYTDKDWIRVRLTDIETDDLGFSFWWDVRRGDWHDVELSRDSERDSAWDHYLMQERQEIEELERERTRS